MADTGKGRTYPATDEREQAVNELHAPAADSIDSALGPNFDAWAKHVQEHVQLPDADDDGWVEPATLAVPILEYGDGPNDYISTDVDAGQVIVRDGNDPTGRAWKYPLKSFLRFVAHSQGKKLPGDDEDEAKGDSMYEAARKAHERTGAQLDAERKAAAGDNPSASKTRAAGERAK
jgi:hypothetical protein